MIKPAPIQPILNSRHRISESVSKFNGFVITLDNGGSIYPVHSFSTKQNLGQVYRYTRKRARYSLHLPKHLAILNPHRALQDRLGRPPRSGRHLASLDIPPAGRRSFLWLAPSSIPG